MLKINNFFYIILALPLLVMPPWFFTPDWGKTIIFKSLVAIMLFLFFYKNKNINLASFRKNYIAWLLLGLFLVYLIASIFSPDPFFSFWGSPFRSGGFVNFAFYIIFCLLIFATTEKDETWQKYFDFSILTGVIVSLIAVIQFHGLVENIFLHSPGRPGSTMGGPTILGVYLLLLIFMAISFALKTLSKYKKVFYLLVSALFFYVILITETRAAWLALIISAIYFLLAFPKKMPGLKIGVLVILALVCAFVFYANTSNYLPNFITSRLSYKTVLEDPRFSTWVAIDWKLLKDKPVLGYGPENFYIGFDKYFEPTTPYLNTKAEQWWDRAHNILIQTASDAGFLALALYILLFVFLFWQLQKNRIKDPFASHGLQTTLIAYFAANFFGFDTFSTYLLFFLIIAYTMHLTQNSELKTQISKPLKILTFILFLILIIFLWQYNLAPFFANAKISKAEALVEQKQCQSLELVEQASENKLLTSYAATDFIMLAKTCGNFYPENILDYKKRGIKIVNKALEIQPKNTRFWIYLGNLSTSLADKETDRAKKIDLINQAIIYFKKTLELSPKRQDAFIGLAKLAIVAEDYQRAQNYSKECIVLNPKLADCYWELGIAQIYSKNLEDGKNNIKTAVYKGFDQSANQNMIELINAYGSILDYQDMLPIAEKLLEQNPKIDEYKSLINILRQKLSK